eukprot:TRINITY_DN1424_c1_g1_i1.p1 TRINITY_DN1424_c1_g1~~TRINITY_DN1424_c1_g1_i1.p1  ORF type:complete len:258 (-),score=95.57 TRINITY_DN1424_c1_g1_i1:17-790(-)
MTEQTQTYVPSVENQEAPPTSINDTTDASTTTTSSTTTTTSSSSSPSAPLPTSIPESASISTSNSTPESVDASVSVSRGEELLQQNKALQVQIQQQAVRIRDLEQNSNVFKKKLEHAEELLCELQWDPSQDLFHYRQQNDTETVEQLQEKKIFQMLEQMRIMEKALKEKQKIIDALHAQIQTSDFHASVGSPQSTNLQYDSSDPNGIVVSSDQLRGSGLSQSGEYSEEEERPQQRGWFSYIPFVGGRAKTEARAVHI